MSRRRAEVALGRERVRWQSSRRRRRDPTIANISQAGLPVGTRVAEPNPWHCFGSYLCQFVVPEGISW